MERKKRTGVPTKWDPKFTKIAFQFALLGATEVQVAQALDVKSCSIAYWKKVHPEFKEAWENGKDKADAKVVESFYNNCHDRYVLEEEAKVVGGEVKIVEVRKFHRGDKWAQSRWLSLRCRGEWTEAQRFEITNNSTNINIALKEYSFEELKMLESIGYKQLPQHDGDTQ